MRTGTGKNKNDGNGREGRILRRKGGRAVLTAAFIAAAVLAGGCQLAREDMGSSAGRDRLAGVYITRDYVDLFDMESYLDDHMNQIAAGKDLTAGESDSAKYGQRLYAEIRETAGEEQKEYVFPGVEGLFFAMLCEADEETGEDYMEMKGAPGISDMKGSMGDSMKLEGTVYVAASENRNVRFFCNPVYQTADGEVYLVSGNGVSGNLTEGAAFATSLEESWQETADGQKQAQSMEISVRFEGKQPCEAYVIAQMDAEGNRLEEITLQADGEFPEKILARPDTAWILCELIRTREDGTREILHQVLDLTKEENTLSLFGKGENDLLIEKDIEIRTGKEL